jgi:hypothetical protein
VASLDEVTVRELDVFQGMLAAGVPVSAELRWRLPPEPWSYAGPYVNIVWGIQIQVDVPAARDPIYEQPFIVAPDR